jgi:enoyl-CoA hydratase/carnithine racemase
MAEVAADSAIRCVILRGAGAAFGAGADVAEFASERDTPAKAAAYAEIMGAALGALRDCPVPTVAQIHGACAGAGLEVAIHCDLRIAGDGSKFGAPVQRLGITMPYPEIAALCKVAARRRRRSCSKAGCLARAKLMRRTRMPRRAGWRRRRGEGERAPDCRRRSARPSLAQEVRAPAARPDAPDGGGDRGILCRLRDRGLSSRHQGVPGQGEAALSGALDLEHALLAQAIAQVSEAQQHKVLSAHLGHESRILEQVCLGDAAAGARRIDDVDVTGVIGMKARSRPGATSAIIRR